MNIKSLLCVLLVLALSISLFSCVGGKDDSSKDISKEEQSDISDDYVLKEKDLGGAEFRFLVPDSSYVYYESFDIYAEELGEGVINDAVYERNMQIEEKYKCKILADKSSGIAQLMRQLVDAGDETYNVFMPMLNDAAQIISSGAMKDLNSLDDLNLDKPWWDQNANKDLAIGGKLFFTTGDLNTLDNDCTMVMFFNKKLAREYNLGDLYEMVNNKEWTIDKVYEISKIGTIDNGDGVWNNEDKYGLHIAFNAPHSFYFSAGGTLGTMQENGKINLGLKEEENIRKLKHIFEISYSDDVLTNKTQGANTFEAVRDMFLNDQVIFTTFALIDIRQFKETIDFEFGILPYPLYDKDQEEYRCLISSALVPVVAIPQNCPNPEDTALVLEAMSYLSQGTLKKAYYDITLKSRTFQDMESREMLDIIFASRVYDLGFIYNWGGMGQLIENMNSRNSDDIVSEFDSIEAMVQDAIEKTFEGVDFLR